MQILSCSTNTRRSLLAKVFSDPEATALERIGGVRVQPLQGLVDLGLMSPPWEAMSIAQFTEIATILGSHCLSTGFIWVQHVQQLACLLEHGQGQVDEVLSDVRRHATLLGSVTTQPGRGGELLRVKPAIQSGPENTRHIQRKAPVVSYGEQAGWFTLTMRASERSSVNDAWLVVVGRSDPGTIRVVERLDAMGMRGAGNVSMEFDVMVPQSRVLPVPLREISLRTMIPLGHIGWGAIWYGAARGAYDRLLERWRTDLSRMDSSLQVHRLGQLGVWLDLMAALLRDTTVLLDDMRRNGAGLAEYASSAFNARLNNLKVACAQLSFQVVDGLMELEGLSMGYLARNGSGLERVFRDLRSASLMFHDDRLLSANGKMALLGDATDRAALALQSDNSSEPLASRPA